MVDAERGDDVVKSQIKVRNVNAVDAGLQGCEEDAEGPLVVLNCFCGVKGVRNDLRLVSVIDYDPRVQRHVISVPHERNVIDDDVTPVIASLGLIR